MRTALESRIGLDMKDYKEYIDNEMMVTMAQMDKPSRILDYLYLVSGDAHLALNLLDYWYWTHTVIYLSLLCQRVQNGMLPTLKNYTKTSIQINVLFCI